MKKYIRILICGIIFFLLSPIGPAYAASAIPSPMDNYVNDFAGVLSSQTERKVRSLGQELENKTGAEVTVVIIDSLGGIPVEDYSNQLFREWGIGQKGKDNGVLLLIALNDRKSRIEVGYGLEGRLPDGKTGRIQDEYLIPFLKENDYDSGVVNTYYALANEVAEEYGVELSGLEGYVPSRSEDETDSFGFIPAMIIILFIADLVLLRGRVTRFLIDVLIWSLISGGRRGGRGGRGGYGGGGFGGGGFGGGSFGGGSGGGFGGGSSGGGGSSRSW